MKRRAVSGVILAAILFFSGGATAYASEPIPDETAPPGWTPGMSDGVLRVETPTTRSSPSDQADQPEVSTRAASPAGCLAKTDYAHKSGNDASVHGRTQCSRAVTRLTAQTSLWRIRWWGGENIKTGNLMTATGASKTYDSTPHSNCYGQGTYTYYGVTKGTSLEGGATYSAEHFGTQKTFTC